MDVNLTRGLRNKPIAVAAYNSPNGCILAPSIEAKTYGIKTGMRIYEAKMLCPNLIIRLPDPEKYRDVHKKFINIFKTYSPNVYPKSIDEAIIDFSGTENLNYDLSLIAKEIKERMKKEIGEWIKCSIGISTNRLLAKLAAGIKKPDGLIVIDHTNLIDIYQKIELMDFCGINVRYERRLNENGIFSATDFYNADLQKLQRIVFRSISGRYWYERLRGWETDDIDFETKTIGHQYALKIPTNDNKRISRLLMKLCEKMGRRMRKNGFRTKGIHVACVYKDRSYWHKASISGNNLYTTLELFKKGKAILSESPKGKLISKLSINCYELTKDKNFQRDLFDVSHDKKIKISRVMDEINNTYGEFTITPATMMGMEKEILDRIAFGRGSIR